MDALLTVAALVGGSVLLALGGLVVVARLVPCDVLTPHTAVASAVYAALAVVYGVILGQLVVAAWDDFEDARAAEIDEAAALFDLIRLAEAFPDPERGRLQQAALAYGGAVVADEWPAMARGEAPSATAAAAIDDLYRRYTALAATPIGALAPYAASLTDLNELDDARGARLLASRRHLPELMWAVLMVGGVLTVGFAYLFGVADRRLHALMVAALAAVIALLLVLVAELDSPFRGLAQISPDGFTRVLGRAAELASPPATPDAVP